MAVTTVAPAPVAEDPGPRRLTIEEFERIPDDLFPEGERAELIDGHIYTRMGQNDPHYFALLFTIEALRAAFGPEFVVASQMPTRYGTDSKVEPDVLVLRGSPRDYQGRRADPRIDVVLLVEVSDSTLSRDQGMKARLYAWQGIPEYWIVNLQKRTLEVRGVPNGALGGYTELKIYGEGDSVPVNGGAAAVADLLPKPE